MMGSECTRMVPVTSKETARTEEMSRLEEEDDADIMRTAGLVSGRSDDATVAEEERNSRPIVAARR